LITCIPAEEIDFEISHFHNFGTSVTLTLNRVIQHTVYPYQILFNSEKLFVDAWKGRQTLRPALLRTLTGVNLKILRNVLK